MYFTLYFEQSSPRSMPLQRYLTRLLFIILSIPLAANAQRNVFHFSSPPDFNQSSYATYIYRVPLDSVRRIVYTSPLIDPNEAWLRNPAYIIPNWRIDSLLTSKNFPVGYYMAVRAERNNVLLSVHHMPGFIVHIIDVQRVKVLLITDTAGCELADASVSIGRHTIPYDSTMNGYVMKDFSNRDEIRVKYKDDIQFLTCSVWGNEDYEPRPKRRNETSDYNSRIHDYNGYLVTNKPKYMPHDTVKWKAYIQQPLDKNRPVREALRVNFLSQYNGEVYHIAQKYKHAEPGVFFGEFVLGDSVDVDRLYTLELYGTQSAFRINQTFKVEDYLLDETHLRVTGEDISPYQPGDSVNLYAYAYNSNNLPVLDGQISVTIFPGQYNISPKKKAFIPDTLYSAIVPVNPDGETNIGFSTAGFPEELCTMRCLVSLFNSNYERKDTTFFLNYAIAPRYIRLTRDGRKVRAELISNKKSVPGVGTYKVNPVYKYSEEHVITFPFDYTLTPEDQYLTFNLVDISGKEKSTASYSVPDVKLSGISDFVGDTAMLRIFNPLHLRYRYSIFIGQDFYGYGVANSDTLIKVLSRKGKTVSVIGSYTWRAAGQQQRFDIFKRDRELNIDLQKKDIIYPGQRDTITVHLSNKDGKPIDKTNVTVLAFNAQFVEDYTPTVPYGGLLYPAYEPRKFRTIQQMSMTGPGTMLATKDWLSLCGADTIFFYKQLYLLPDDIAWVTYDIPKSIQSQVGIYLQSRSNYFQPDIIYVDNYPVYIRRAVTTNPSAFFVPEGIHSITIRTSDAEYRIPQFQVCAGMKTDLYINADSVGPFYWKDTVGRKVTTHQRTNHLNTYIYRSPMPDTLGYYEMDKVAGSLFIYRSEFPGQPYILQQYTTQITVSSYQGSYYAESGQQSFSLVGPVSFSDSMYFFQQWNTKLRFLPERNYIFTFRPQMTRVERQSIYNYLKYRLVNNMVWPSASVTIPNPDDLDTFIVQPKIKTISLQDNYIVHHIKKTVHYSFNSSHSTIPDSLKTANITITNHSDSSVHYVILHQIGYDGRPDILVGNNRYYSHRLVPGTYEITVIWANGHYTEFPSLTVRPNGTTLFPISYMPEKDLYSFRAAPYWLKLYVVTDTLENPNSSSYTISYSPASSNVVTTANEAGQTITYYQSNTDGSAGIDGTVTDPKGEPLMNVSVVVSQGGIRKAITGTDIDGHYEAKPLSPGLYDVAFTNQGQKATITGVRVSPDEITRVNYRFAAGTELSSVVVTAYKSPLIRPSGKVSVKSSEQIEKLVNQGTNDIVALGPSVYQSKQGGYMSIGGGRGTGDLYVVDGVQYPASSLGTTNLPVGSIDQVSTYTSGTPARFGDASGGIFPRSAGGYAEQERNGGGYYLNSSQSQAFLNAFLGNMLGASGMRKEFRDWAIWEPNLWTGSDGNTSFNVTYPGNNTAWKTYVLAMNRDGYAGRILNLTRSYKPLSASLSVPRFLRYGDLVEGIGKVSNYTKQSFHLHSVSTQDEKVIANDTITVHNTKVSVLPIAAPTTNVIDTALLTASYNIVADNGYTDGEERSMPVYPVGLVENKGQFLYLAHDSSVLSTPDISNSHFTGKSRVYVDGSLLEVMLREIEKLKVDPHGCIEQLTTKLLSIYYEESIKQILGDTKFNNTRAKRKILEEIIRGQHPDGSFGWWSGNERDLRITNYVISTLQKINKDGWLNVVIRRGLSYLDAHLTDMNLNDQIASMLTLSTAGYASNYKPLLDNADSTHPSLYNKLAITKIRKEQHLPYRPALDTIIKLRTETMAGTYWDYHDYDWYRDDIASTLLAYSLIKNDSIYSYLTPSVMRYLLSQRRNGYYRSTASSGLVLTTLLPDMLDQKPTKADIKKNTYVTISGSIKDSITSFPRSYTINEKSPQYHFTKKGISPVYISVVYDYFNINPQPHDSDFSVHTYFLNSKHDTVVSLKAGEKITLRTTVKCAKESEYVMVEVPIPAGCVQVDKQNNYYHYNEAARENFKDQTDIFCRTLEPTTYTFDITLEARYRGTYNISPARASMMYYPEEYGHTGVKKVQIK